MECKYSSWEVQHVKAFSKANSTALRAAHAAVRGAESEVERLHQDADEAKAAFVRRGRESEPSEPRIRRLDIWKCFRHFQTL